MGLAWIPVSIEETGLILISVVSHGLEHLSW